MNDKTLLPRAPANPDWKIPCRGLPPELIAAIEAVQAQVKQETGRTPANWQVLYFFWQVAEPMLQDALGAFVAQWNAENPPKGKSKKLIYTHFKNQNNEYFNRKNRLHT